jgi:hypothetical protein
MFGSLYFDLVVTTTALCFQTLKEKEEEIVENAPVETSSGDHPETAVQKNIFSLWLIFI